MSEVTAAGLLAFDRHLRYYRHDFLRRLTDRFDSRRLLGWYYGLRGLARILTLRPGQHLPQPRPVYRLLRPGLGGNRTANGTPSDDIFGKARTVIMFGWIFASHQLGAAAAASGAGAMRTDSATTS